MDKLKLEAYAKINLGLDVVRRLENGYHEVKMIMQTVSLSDFITIERERTPGIQVFTDTDELSAGEDNLVYKAAALLIDEFKIDGGIKISLEKNIPIAAGLAGGSSDAAAVLRGMNKMFALDLSEEKLQVMGVKLGADIPYCVVGGTYLSEGIGEKLTELASLPKCYVLLAKPDISVSTKWVYENLHLENLKSHPDIDAVKNAIMEHNIVKMCGYLENVLESVTVNQYSVIADLKKSMTDRGALVSLMSGSGPTVFGIFNDKKTMRKCAQDILELNLAKYVFETVTVDRYK